MPPVQYIGVSTKAYFGYQQTLDWLAGVVREVRQRPELAANGVVPFVIPSFPMLAEASRMIADTGIRLGAQNVAVSGGALTGEVAAPLLAELGVTLVEIGHAERRARFFETDEVVAEKFGAAVDAGLTPLLCVGEPSRMPPTEAAAWCVGQALRAVGDPGAGGALLLAYEPVWAIGAPAPADPAFVSEVVAEIRASLEHELSHRQLSIVYGGSAGPGLLAELPGVDGLFLGRFAHDPAHFGRVLDDALAITLREVAQL